MSEPLRSHSHSIEKEEEGKNKIIRLFLEIEGNIRDFENGKNMYGGKFLGICIHTCCMRDPTKGKQMEFTLVLFILS